MTTFADPRSTSFAATDAPYGVGRHWRPRPRVRREPRWRRSAHEAAYPRPEGLDTGHGDRRPIEPAYGFGMGC